MPDALKSFIDERVKSRGYGSHSEYLRDLIRRDEQEAAKDKLRSLIAEGIISPIGRSWSELKTELDQKAK